MNMIAYVVHINIMYCPNAPYTKITYVIEVQMSKDQRCCQNNKVECPAKRPDGSDSDFLWGFVVIQ